MLAHPTEKNIQAVSFTYARTEWKVLDPAIADDIEFLKKVEDGEFIVTSRTLDDKQWTVAYMLDDGPVKFYRYDRDAGAEGDLPVQQSRRPGRLPAREDARAA